jgi:hypothetical protein
MEETVILVLQTYYFVQHAQTQQPVMTAIMDITFLEWLAYFVMLQFLIVLIVILLEPTASCVKIDTMG